MLEAERHTALLLVQAGALERLRAEPGQRDRKRAILVREAARVGEAEGENPDRRLAAGERNQRDGLADRLKLWSELREALACIGLALDEDRRPRGCRQGGGQTLAESFRSRLLETVVDDEQRRAGHVPKPDRARGGSQRRDSSLQNGARDLVAGHGL